MRLTKEEVAKLRSRRAYMVAEGWEYISFTKTDVDGLLDMADELLSPCNDTEWLRVQMENEKQRDEWRERCQQAEGERAVAVKAKLEAEQKVADYARVRQSLLGDAVYWRARALAAESPKSGAPQPSLESRVTALERLCEAGCYLCKAEGRQPKAKSSLKIGHVRTFTTGETTFVFDERKGERRKTLPAYCPSNGTFWTDIGGWRSDRRYMADRRGFRKPSVERRRFWVADRRQCEPTGYASGLGHPPYYLSADNKWLVDSRNSKVRDRRKGC